MTELKPCPYCKCQEPVWCHGCFTKSLFLYLACPNCHIEKDDFEYFKHGDKDHDQAIQNSMKAWNEDHTYKTDS